MADLAAGPYQLPQRLLQEQAHSCARTQEDTHVQALWAKGSHDARSQSKPLAGT